MIRQIPYRYFKFRIWFWIEKRADVMVPFLAMGFILICDKNGKYNLINNSSESDLDCAYSNTSVAEQKNIVLFTETQLCVETEFLLRHLDEIGMNKKRWFFGTLEAKINDISKLVVK